jgi:UDP-glucose 4-epimerase
MNANILITGGAGYIGAHVNKCLSERGHKTLVLDNLIRGHRSSVKWGEFVEGNIGDPDLLDRIFYNNSIVSVIHLAAYAYVGESVLEPFKYWKNNVVETIKLMEKCAENKVKRFILSSTCSTYGDPQNIPIQETHEQRPINPYGGSKLAVELLLKNISNLYGIKYFILRYFNAAGADTDGDIGECHLPETHLIPIILNSMLDGTSIQVNGNDYDSKDGTCVRDYVHVSDLAKGHYSALRFLEEGGDSQECNLGLGRGYSVKEVIESAKNVTGNDVTVKNYPRRVGDPPILIADTSLAKTLLNWDPVYDNIDSIIETAWNWQKNIHNTTKKI